MRTKISRKNIRGEFVKKVEELSGQKLLSCYQCGKCTAGCPISFAMDIPPNQVVRLVQLGQEDEVLRCRTIWLCASCLTCSSRCPRGVKLPKIMEALRALVLRKGIDVTDIPKIPADVLARAPQQAFVSNYRKYTS